MTGELSATALRDRVAALLDHSQGGFALARCGVESYHEITCSLGPGTGAELLSQLARRLSAQLKPGEVWARYADGTFAVVLPGAGPATVHHRLEDLVRATSGWASDAYAQVTAGAAGAAEVACAEDLFTRADLALAEASRRGPGAVALFEKHLLTAARARVRLDTDLRRAVEAGRLGVHYQPVVALRGRRTVGYEALARWLDPVRGWVSPTEFIPAAERSGLIDDVGMAVLRTALADGRKHGGRQDFWLSVNVSPLQLDDEAFARRLMAVINRFGVGPNRLRVEVTETALLESERARTQLAEVRRQGVRVLVDDFGTGYSSLASLRRLPVDGIKIARELLHDAEGGPDATVVRAVQLLAAGAGVTEVIAEGVESAAEAKALAGLAVPLAQGFHLGRPVPAQRAMRRSHTPA
ncbi:bifunctional diguanylate cyclase/phosphodiesterase [Phytohabitans rumicis]|uniref:EAL domain-containing protein n=1 Tax=Phytohabitans rumicis TaxID=1076125 RepID=A0A6V8LE66_9ACTN|nr:bifunctional diguanylate cyclase/phosphodiesterase [Phytohabitans rumicis]GFJ92869.1 hypothetical protein Prum_065110 [Phytohabitans rumicis]